MHPDVDTVAGYGLGRYRDEPFLDDAGELGWRPATTRHARRRACCAPSATAFAPDGGIRVLDGALGRAVMKVSAVAPEHRVVTAPARVFDDQARLPRRLRPRRARPRPRRGRPPPGPARQRHAGAAQAHAGARRAAGPRPPRRARHRRAHVGRLGQGPGRDPLHARGRRAAARCHACATATSCAWTPTAAGSRSTSTSASASPSLPEPATPRHRPRAVRGLPRARRPPRTPAPRSSPPHPGGDV